MPQPPTLKHHWEGSHLLLRKSQRSGTSLPVQSVTQSWPWREKCFEIVETQRGGGPGSGSHSGSEAEQEGVSGP